MSVEGDKPCMPLIWPVSGMIHAKAGVRKKGVMDRKSGLLKELWHQNASMSRSQLSKARVREDGPGGLQHSERRMSVRQDEQVRCRWKSDALVSLHGAEQLRYCARWTREKCTGPDHKTWLPFRSDTVL